MAGQPRDPLGTTTNCVKIDQGTLSRNSNHPPGTTGVTKTQSEPSYFDIKRLFPTMDVLGWISGKNFMKFWAEGNVCVANNKKNSDKSTIGVNVDNSCMRIYELQWDWLLSFKMAANHFDKFQLQRIFNDAAKAQIINQYGRLHTNGQLKTSFNAWLKEGLAPKDYRSHIKNHQLQYWEVKPGISDPSKFDDLIAALNNYAYYSMYKGEVYSGEEYKKLKKPPTINLPNLAPNIVEEEFAKLESGEYKAIIFVSNVGVYAGDIYEFNGGQYLATWDLVKHKVTSSYLDAAKPWEDWDNPEDVKITNQTYIDYRAHTNKGGDFLALSPIKLTGQKLLIPVK